MGMYQSSFDFSDPLFVTFLWFGVAWVIIGLIGKVLGSGSISLAFGFKFKEALKIGVGMMARAEVLIVCAQKGIDANLVSPDIMPFCLVLILISSFLTPICLKLLFNEKEIPPLEKQTPEKELSKESK